MKRIVALVLVLATAFSLSACCCLVDETGGDILQFGQQDIQSNTANVKHTGKKITGPITKSTLFSEGLALVMTKTEPDKIFCIDINGYIVFELEKSEVDKGYNVYTPDIKDKFMNGFIMINGMVCDASGNLTKPEDVGAARFFGHALEGGYIFATTVTGDYSGTVEKMGVMNTQFEWVINPTEEFYLKYYEVIANPYERVPYYEDKVYFDSWDMGYWLDLKTGLHMEPKDISIGSEKWFFSELYNEYYDILHSVTLDLSEHHKIEYSTDFVEGKAALTLHNSDVGKSYYTLINTSGEFLFEPIEIEGTIIYYDGEHYIVGDDCEYIKQITFGTLKCYDSQMNLLGEICPDIGAYYQMYDGVVTISNGGIVKNVRYYKMNGSPLFELKYATEETATE